MGNRIDNSWIILFGFMVICKLFDHDYYISVEQSNLVMKRHWRIIKSIVSTHFAISVNEIEKWRILSHSDDGFEYEGRIYRHEKS
jgi:hypothetical protein